MTALPSLKAHFSRALAGGAGRLHLAAHSHHLWPDVTFAAHSQAWQDAATLWDDKWDKVFSSVIPQAQLHVARHLNLADPSTIAFAPNTHEFVLRILSALPHARVARILTTDSEFHSFTRQAARLEEDGLVHVQRIAAEPFATFPARFADAASSGEYDLIFFSHVHFNSGYVVPDIARIVGAVSRDDTLIVVDGYHAFMALPADLSALQHRVFYLGGGYKYACAGEGACFLACPPGFAPRPRDTGWYAAFGHLSGAAHRGVPYANDGGRFMGATFDPSGLYRLNAAMRWFAGLNLDADQAHARARAMQAGFIAAMDAARIDGLRCRDLILPSETTNRGNFLAYRSPHAQGVQRCLMESGIVTDVRGDVLRIGFGLYHDPGEIIAIVERVAEALRK